MDLHNNAIGRKIVADNPSITEAQLKAQINTLQQNNANGAMISGRPRGALRRRRWGLALVFASLSAACDRPAAKADVATIGRGTLLDSLVGIRIGMPAREVLAIRPRAQYEQYTGLMESLDSTRFVYHVPATESGDSASIRDAPLDRVVAARYQASWDSASTVWVSQVKQLQASRGPARCESIGGSGGGSIAYWQDSLTVLVVAARRAFDTGTGVEPNRLVYEVMAPDQVRVTGSSVPCP